MKFITWNVNGIRSVYRKGNWQEVMRLAPDALLIQETKATPEQMPEEVRQPDGYHVYFNIPKEKRGYSGTALYLKKHAMVSYEMGVTRLDNEGRLIEARVDNLAIYNVYFPNGGMGPERLAYKLDFYDAFLTHILRRRQEGYSIIIGGDVNTAHEPIDLARPKANQENTGFLPEERAWIGEMLRAGFVDTFRYLHPQKTGAYTYWDVKTAARERNVGWRLDYFFISNDLLPNLKSAALHVDIYGSDHCPYEINLALKDM